MRPFVAFVGVALAVTRVDAQQPDYDSMIALRSSAGFRSALEAAETSLSSDPADEVAAGVRALVYGNAVDFLGMPPREARDAKERALARALQVAPTNPWTRAAYGLIRRGDDPSGAERELTRCIEENPAFLDCYNLYGDLLRKTGHEEQAGAVYRRALQRWPGDGELLISYALHLQETNNVDQAVVLLANLTREQPTFARGHWHLAVMLYESNGDIGVARREARRALELDPLIWNGERFLKILDGVPDT